MSPRHWSGRVERSFWEVLPFVTLGFVTVLAVIVAVWALIDLAGGGL